MAVAKKVAAQWSSGMPRPSRPVPVEELNTPVLTFRGVSRPWGVALNQRGEVVVTERSGNCVSIFRHGGEKLSFGEHGTGQEQFDNPLGITIDGEGNILVSEYSNYRIQKFTPEGRFLKSVGTKVDKYPYGIAFNSTNNKVYVGDWNNCVQILNSDLDFLSSFGRLGSGKGEFSCPIAMAFDSTGNVYVADEGNHRIQVFTAEGRFLRMFGRRGCGRGELHRPLSVAIDTSDRVYVGDWNHRVSVFTSDGHSITSFGKEGKGPGEFNYPCGLAVDASGVVYVCDRLNNRVQIF